MITKLHRIIQNNYNKIIKIILNNRNNNKNKKGSINNKKKIINQNQYYLIMKTYISFLILINYLMNRVRLMRK